MKTTDYRSDELSRVDATDLEGIYAELRERERLQREWKWAVRNEFWRMSGHGTGQRYKARYRKAFRNGDMTYLNAFDVITDELCETFPELAGDDACQRVFDLIAEGVDRMPAAEETYRKAVDRLLDEPGREEPVSVCEFEDVPF